MSQNSWLLRHSTVPAVKKSLEGFKTLRGMQLSRNMEPSKQQQKQRFHVLQLLRRFRTVECCFCCWRLFETDSCFCIKYFFSL